MRLSTVSGGVLAAAALMMLGMEAAGQGRVATSSPMLQLGLRQVQEGSYAAAMFTLDNVIKELAPEVETRRDELVLAWVHKGWALVELDQEPAARACFRAALQQNPNLRLSRDAFPTRVVDTFDSMRPDGGKADRGSYWDPVKVVATAALTGLGGATAIAALRDEEINPFTQYYGAYGVSFLSQGGAACSRMTAPPFSGMSLSGNLDGSAFVVRLSPEILRAFVLTGGDIPGAIQLDGSFAGAQGGDVTLSGRAETGVRRRVLGSITVRGCTFSFQST